MDDYYVKNGKGFMVRFCETKRLVVIGTTGELSNFASQMAVKDLMQPLKWERNGLFLDLCDPSGHTCVGVIYKVPRFVNAKRKLDALFNRA